MEGVKADRAIKRGHLHKQSAYLALPRAFGAPRRAKGQLRA